MTLKVSRLLLVDLRVIELELTINLLFLEVINITQLGLLAVLLSV